MARLITFFNFVLFLLYLFVGLQRPQVDLENIIFKNYLKWNSNSLPVASATRFNFSMVTFCSPLSILVINSLFTFILRANSPWEIFRSFLSFLSSIAAFKYLALA